MMNLFHGVEILNPITRTIIIAIIISLLSLIFIFLKRPLLQGYIWVWLTIQNELLKCGINPIKYWWSRFCIHIKSLWERFQKKENLEPKRQVKGLVGILSMHVKKVANITLPNETHAGLCKIFFAEEGGDYNKRNTHLPAAEIKKQCNIIEKHYTQLREKIERDFPDDPLFIYEEKIKDENGKEQITSQSIIDKFLEIYSFDNIKAAIEERNKSMKNNNAIHFIGDKIGVKGYNMHKGELSLYVYQTDHFTWQVFKYIFKDKKSFFQEIIRRVNRTNERKKQLLVESLAFVFSSFGIDIILEGRTCKGDRKIIIASRSGKIESDGRATLHVSVNECFSRTDTITPVRDSEYSLYQCVKRGIQEELGIKEDLISDDLIHFHDFAIVSDEGEIGLSCHVDLSKVMPVEQALLYPGQDKYLEVEEFVLLPYPKMLHFTLAFSEDSEKYRRSFFGSTLNDRFNLPWQSFTPVLISRVFIRNINYNLLGYSILFALFVGFIYLINLLCIYCGLDLEEWELLKGFIFGSLVSVTGYWIRQWKARRKYRKFKFLQPFVSQWYGNAKVIQSSGQVEEKIISQGLTFSINNKDYKRFKSNIISSDQLSLIKPPYCSVRIKRNEDNFTETPVSLYQMKKKDSKQTKGNLKYYNLNVTIDKPNLIIFIDFILGKDQFSKDVKINKISFIDEKVCNYSVSLKDKFDKEALEKLYKIDTNECETIALTVQGKIEMEKTNLILRDLFSFKEDYYWSCVSEETQYKKADLTYEVKSTGKKGIDFFAEVWKYILESHKDKGSVRCKVSGPKKQMEVFLNTFIKHPNNKRKIDEIELYMLQLYCIRYDIIIADIEYKKRIKAHLTACTYT